MKGSGKTGQKVLFGSHHDAYLGPASRTPSVATQLLIARAMR